MQKTNGYANGLTNGHAVMNGVNEPAPLMVLAKQILLAARDRGEDERAYYVLRHAVDRAFENFTQGNGFKPRRTPEAISDDKELGPSYRAIVDYAYPAYADLRRLLVEHKRGFVRPSEIKLASRLLDEVEDSFHIFMKNNPPIKTRPHTLPTTPGSFRWLCQEIGGLCGVRTSPERRYRGENAEARLAKSRRELNPEYRHETLERWLRLVEGGVAARSGIAEYQSFDILKRSAQAEGVNSAIRARIDRAVGVIVERRRDLREAQKRVVDAGEVWKMTIAAFGGLEPTSRDIPMRTSYHVAVGRRRRGWGGATISAPH